MPAHFYMHIWLFRLFEVTYMERLRMLLEKGSAKATAGLCERGREER